MSWITELSIQNKNKKGKSHIQLCDWSLSLNSSQADNQHNHYFRLRILKKVTKRKPITNTKRTLFSKKGRYREFDEELFFGKRLIITKDQTDSEDGKSSRWEDFGYFPSTNLFPKLLSVISTNYKTTNSSPTNLSIWDWN